MINESYLENFRPITEDGLYGTMSWQGADHTLTFTVDVTRAVAYIVVSDHHINLRTGLVLAPSGLSIRIVPESPQYTMDSAIPRVFQKDYSGKMALSQKSNDTAVEYKNFIGSLFGIQEEYSISHFYIVTSARNANWVTALQHSDAYQKSIEDGESPSEPVMLWGSPLGVAKDDDQQLRADGILFATRD